MLGRVPQATEWAESYGGHKKRKTGAKLQGALPFDCCALTLLPFKNPACTRDGVLFEHAAIVDFVRTHGKSPASGAKTTLNDVILLKMAKDGDGRWMCPVTHKVFTNHSKVAAVATSGNVYAYDALRELCLSRKGSMRDLIDSTEFARTDVVVIHDPEDVELSKRRDISNLEHLKRAERAEPGTRPLGESAERILATARSNVEVAAAQREARRLAAAKVASDPSRPENKGLTATFLRVRDLGARTDEVCAGSRLTSGDTSRSLTSSAVGVSTSRDLRPATDDELLASRWKILRSLGKKGYARLETNLGPLNIEVHCDVTPRAAENFLGLCASGYYDRLTFHRVVAGFVAQAGDPKADGTGGESLWGNAFADEFDSRLTHDARGVLGYANSGRDKNRSQFYITFKPCPHLDNKHTVFGRLVGGHDTLAILERLPVDKDHRPTPGREVAITTTTVFVDPVAEADRRFEAAVAEAVERRVRGESGEAAAPAPPPPPADATPHTTMTVGKYRKQATNR